MRHLTISLLGIIPWFVTLPRLAIAQAMPFAVPSTADNVATQVMLSGHPALEHFQVNSLDSQPQETGPQKTGETLFQLGKTQYQKGQFEQAIPLLEQAVEQFQQDSNPWATAIALSNLSLTHQQLGQWSQAERFINQSLRLLDRSYIDAVHAPTSEVAAQEEQAWISVLDIQASLQFSTGETEAALETWKQIEALARRQDQPLKISQSQIKQAEALRVLGFYERARTTLEEAATELQQQDLQSGHLASNSPKSHQPEHLEEYQQLRATQLRLLGNALRLSGNLPRAQDILEQSLAIATQLQPSPQKSAVSSAVLLDLANTAKAEGKLTQALAHYEAAIAANRDPAFQVQIQISQLELLQVADPSAAQQLRQELLLAVDRLPMTQPGLYSRISLAQELLQGHRLGQQNSYPQRSHQHDPLPPVQAMALEQLLQDTLEQATQLGDRRSLSYARGTLGTFYEQSGELQLALALTQTALADIQGLNLPDISYRWNWQLGRLRAMTGDRANAILDYDRAIANLGALRQDLVAVDREVQFSFRENVEPVYRQAVALLTQTAPNQSPEDKAKNLEQARAYIEALQIAELDDYFREACLEGRSVALDQISQENPNTAVIYPILLDDRLEVIVKIPGHALQHHSILQPQADVEATLDSLRQNLLTPSRTRQVLQQAKTLHQWLIEPVEGRLDAAEIDTLVFVLDGSLRNVPMGVLFDGQRYLIEKYALGVSLGLQLLDPKAIAQEQLNLLAVGLADPPSEYSPPFNRLEFVETELEQIEQTGIQGTQLLNQAFTEARLAETMQQQDFNVVHIATHGQFSSDAENTFILAADGEIAVAGLDRLLRERSQFDQRAIELLVLSACQTATGDPRAALGIAGVTVKAGARSTMASLWSVNDRSTSILMGDFYAQLAALQSSSDQAQPPSQSSKKSLTKAEMLRRAQLNLLQSDDFRRPHYWAPFILVGNWL